MFRGPPAGSARSGDALPEALPDPDERRALARLAAAVAAGDEPAVEAAAWSLAGRLPRCSVEEVVLQLEALVDARGER